eukprot:TRINITY_DN7429_c0_g1_i1.p1 TRINITY_DN7429_c0_g1~~TRINITY_DN7429_c0_g1_i1.p1  ORF type:complete len:124 (-),score=7.99 TRINITY_DN7429_c0_g1_i1:344-715(-)
MSKNALLNILFIAITLVLCYFIWSQEQKIEKLQDTISLLDKNIKQFELQILDYDFEINLKLAKKAEKKNSSQESMSVFTAFWRGFSERIVENFWNKPLKYLWSNRLPLVTTTKIDIMSQEGGE